ncbi:phage tail tip fiber protein, partial [Enterobacter hormaechei]
MNVPLNNNEKQYAAGMGIGVENTPSGMESQVLFLADRFAVMAQAGGAVTLPFV